MASRSFYYSVPVVPVWTCEPIVEEKSIASVVIELLPVMEKIPAVFLLPMIQLALMALTGARSYELKLVSVVR